MEALAAPLVDAPMEAIEAPRRRRKPLPRVHDGYVVTESVRSEYKRAKKAEEDKTLAFLKKRRKIGPREIKPPPIPRAIQLKRMNALTAPPVANNELALVPASSDIVPYKGTTKKRSAPYPSKRDALAAARSRKQISIPESVVPMAIAAPSTSTNNELALVPANNDLALANAAPLVQLSRGSQKKRPRTVDTYETLYHNLVQPKAKKFHWSPIHPIGARIAATPPPHIIQNNWATFKPSTRILALNRPKKKRAIEY
jgi:hypothetical protein